MTDDQSAVSVDKGSGPAPAPPELCLLHLNFQPCPFCEPVGEVEAATIDTTPRKRRGRPPGRRP